MGSSFFRANWGKKGNLTEKLCLHLRDFLLLAKVFQAYLCVLLCWRMQKLRESPWSKCRLPKAHKHFCDFREVAWGRRTRKKKLAVLLVSASAHLTIPSHASVACKGLAYHFDENGGRGCWPICWVGKWGVDLRATFCFYFCPNFMYRFIVPTKKKKKKYTRWLCICIFAYSNEVIEDHGCPQMYTLMSW